MATDETTTYTMTIERPRSGTVVKITDTDLMGEDDPKFALAMDLGDGRTMHTRAMEADADGNVVEEVVIVSTDIAAPKATAFADAHPLDTNQNDADPAVFQSLIVSDDNVGMWSSAEFPSTPDTTRMYAEDDVDTADVNEAAIMGTFDGGPGTFECVSANNCNIGTDGDGELLTVVGTWHFTPDKGAKVDVPDADYLHYGFWLKKTTDEDGVLTYNEVETFAVSTIDGVRDASSVEGVEGSATYNGGATGVYVKNVQNSDGTLDSATAGHFTADASLTAYFGGTSVAADDEDSITGTINNFALSGEEENAWSVALKGLSGSILDVGTASGTANGGGAAGTFNATFHGDTTLYDHDMDGTTDSINRQPSSVVGEFDANFSNGSVAGGFGARK